MRTMVSHFWEEGWIGAHYFMVEKFAWAQKFISLWMKIAFESQLHIISTVDLNFNILLNIHIFRILKVWLEFSIENRAKILNKFRIDFEFQWKLINFMFNYFVWICKFCQIFCKDQNICWSPFDCSSGRPLYKKSFDYCIWVFNQIKFLKAIRVFDEAN